MTQSYIQVLQALESYTSVQPMIKRFHSDFAEQMNNFSTTGETFPVIYVEPLDNNYLLNTTEYNVRIYCFDRLQKDRSNRLLVLDNCDFILAGLVKWFGEENTDIPIQITSASKAQTMNNATLDYCAGWYIDCTIEVDSFGICEIPFTNTPVISGYTCDIFYTNDYLTCADLPSCDTIVDIQSDIAALSAATSGLTVTGAYLPLSGGTVTGNTLFASGLTINSTGLTVNENATFVTPNASIVANLSSPGNPTINLGYASGLVQANVGAANNNLLLDAVGNVMLRGAAGIVTTHYNNGQVKINDSTGIANNSQLEINNNSTSRVGLFVNGIAGQVANLQEWQTTGTTLAYINKTGGTHIPGLFVTGNSVHNSGVTINGSGLTINTAANTVKFVDASGFFGLWVNQTPSVSPGNWMLLNSSLDTYLNAPTGGRIYFTNNGQNIADTILVGTGDPRWEFNLDVRPGTDNTWNLGTQSKRWKTINTVELSANTISATTYYGNGSFLTGISGAYLPLSGGTVSGTTAIQDASNVNSFNSNSRALFDSTGAQSILWNNRNLNDSSSNPSIDWEGRNTYHANGQLSVRYNANKLINSAGIESLDWSSGITVNGPTLAGSGITVNGSGLTINVTTNSGTLVVTATTGQPALYFNQGYQYDVSNYAMLGSNTQTYINARGEVFFMRLGSLIADYNASRFSFNTNVQPTANNAFDLGTSSLRWNNYYGNSITSESGITVNNKGIVNNYGGGIDIKLSATTSSQPGIWFNQSIPNDTNFMMLASINEMLLNAPAANNLFFCIGGNAVGGYNINQFTFNLPVKANNGISATTISASTITGATVCVNGRIYGTVISGDGNSNIAQTLDSSLSNYWDYTLTGNTTFTFSNTNNGQTNTVVVHQNGSTSGYTATFSATSSTIRWASGLTPTQTVVTGKTDIYTFIKTNGVMYGSVVSNF